MNISKFLVKANINFKDDIFYLSSNLDSDFSNTYITLREKERRLYDDQTVEKLPEYNAGDENLFHEWMLRKASAEKLKEYCLHSFPNATILEIGCGNGWLCNFLSTETNDVFGIDINLKELQQAGKLFYKENRVQFIYGDLFNSDFPENSINIIIFASSIQYFTDLAKILSFCRKLLTPNGEIHILDTHFYKEDEIQSAKERSKVYYQKIGLPEMNNYYFHHTDNELALFNPIQLYNPNSFNQKFKNLTKKNSSIPFPWFKILKS